MSPKTKEQYEVIRQQSKAAIKQAALELFAHKGYASTSISEIAREAGISKGLMYNYFKGKEELLQDIILEAVQVGEQVMREELQHATEPLEQLKRLVDGVFSMVKANFHYWKLLTTLAFQPGITESMEEELMPMKEATLHTIKALFEQMGADDPEKEAYLFGATLDGILLHYISLGEEAYPLEEMKVFFIQHYLKH